MYEHTPTHEVFYRKTARSTWVKLPGSAFLALSDAETLANQLVKVVLTVCVINSSNGQTEYIV